MSNELFGHIKGAYTGATTDRSGLIEAASGGTLFLDEVSEMSSAMQVKLLRVIQEREFMRIGSSTAIKVDVRYLAASNRDLKQAVDAGVLRSDLSTASMLSISRCRLCVSGARISRCWPSIS